MLEPGSRPGAAVTEQRATDRVALSASCFSSSSGGQKSDTLGSAGLASSGGAGGDVLCASLLAAGAYQSSLASLGLQGASPLCPHFLLLRSTPAIGSGQNRGGLK